jgi:hypothetical protein
MEVLAVRQLLALNVDGVFLEPDFDRLKLWPHQFEVVLQDDPAQLKDQ